MRTLLLPHEMVNIVIARQPPEPPKPRRPWKFASFETAQYKIVASAHHAAWTVKRKADGATTYAEIGAEGFERYKRLKRLWRADKARFNKICSLYTFYDETGCEALP